jgi:hypothetical protein
VLDRFFKVIFDLYHCIGAFKSGHKIIQGCSKGSESEYDFIEGFGASLGQATPTLGAFLRFFLQFWLDV